MLSTRPWQQTDAVFVCWMRNNPANMRWYRQSTKISLEDQKKFIAENNAFIIERNRKPVGVLWIKTTGELSLVLDEKDYPLIPQLFKKKPFGFYWGEVFVGNPILTFLLQAGFKTVSVKERAYHKPGFGLIDVIRVMR